MTESSDIAVARRLGELEDHGMLTRTAFATVPATVIYELTEIYMGAVLIYTYS